MSEDTVLKEVRSTREAFARSHGFNVRAMVAALRAPDEAGDWPVVRLAPRLPDAAVAPRAGKSRHLVRPFRPAWAARARWRDRLAVASTGGASR